MIHTTHPRGTGYTGEVVPHTHGHAYQAYQLLHVAFIAAPVIAGLDKFAHMLTDWDKYLAPQIAAILPFSGHMLMLVVGAVEVLAGLIVAIRPRIGAYIVAAWLGGIIVNLLLAGGYLDIALRDLGLMLGALALGRLSSDFDRKPAATVVAARPD